jgi:hypothetical protein
MRGRIIAATLLLAVTQPAIAVAPVVLSNRTNQDIVVTVTAASDRPRRVTIDRGDFAVLTVTGSATVSFISDSRLQTTRIAESSAYAFAASEGSLRLEPLYDGGTPRAASSKEGAQGVVAPPEVAILTVKLLVDRQEPAVREGRNGWEARLRKRIAAASEVLERQCRVRLEVVAVDTWASSAVARDPGEQVSDFERTVATRPALLAIGFGSRSLPIDAGGRIAAPLAVPLSSHILIDESLPLAESQRLEVLVHELGHYLGAVHTKDSESVMRLSPGDGRSLGKSFRIGFDPLNALAINLVAREALKAAPLRKLGALSAATRQQLADLYKEMARLTPDDQTAEKYLRLLEDVPRPQPTRSSDPLVSGARSVVAAVVSASAAAAELGLSGDRLIEHCVRAAAAAAVKLPQSQRSSAFLLGIAVALDTSALLRRTATTRSLWGLVESEEEQQDRLKVVGQPTLLGKHAFARHFVVAAALTSIAGSKAAEPGGIVRELFDAEAAGTFSFSELAIELAGASLARALAADAHRLEVIAGSFTVSDYVPSLNGLEEELGRDEFNRRYGNFTDERFRQRESEVRRRIAELPAYKTK